jgi:hypothetical protein
MEYGETTERLWAMAGTDVRISVVRGRTTLASFGARLAERDPRLGDDWSPEPRNPVVPESGLHLVATIHRKDFVEGVPYAEGVGIRLKRSIEILVVPSRLGQPKTAVTAPVPSGNH